MNRIRFWHVIVVLALAFGIYSERHNLKSKLGMQSQAEVFDGCKDKERCITAYVAPWCPVCKDNHPTFRLLDSYLAKRMPNVGFNLVIGAAKPEENAKEKEILAPLNSVIDDSGDIMKANAIEGFPTWIVRDREGKEIYRTAGGIRLAQEEEVGELLRLLKVQAN
ncbi:MAG: hypothetical protein V4692_03735 [Bdellovibrionota bacterium]